ncbi:hypothetical protein ACI3DD_03145 [Erwinia persicina]
MKRRDAHIGFGRQQVNAEIVGKVVLNAAQRTGNLAELGLPADQRQ